MITYKDAGVDVERGYEAVRRMKQHVAATFDENVLGGLGSFGGFYSIENADVDKPVLVAGTDGVGTKLKLAFLMDKHDTVGIDCVAMCVNDVACQGAKPLIFLDYIATGYLDPAKVEQIVAGVADGCRQAGCALIGGETAEMPDFYPAGEYDLAGFTVGLVGREQSISGERVAEGDVLVGMASSGVHSNGYSLVRKLVLTDGRDIHTPVEALGGKSWGETLLTPTKIYVKSALAACKACDVHGIAHITGGGFIENIPRILPDGLSAQIERGTWPVLPVFTELVKLGGLGDRQAYNTFNMGIGMVFAVKEEEADKLVATLEEQGEKAYRIGRVAKTACRWRKAGSAVSKRIAVLCSGGGTNLQALIDAVEAGTIDGQIVLVLANASKAFALERAKKHGIPAEFVSKKQAGSDEAFNDIILQKLKAADADLVVLAGYLPILGSQVVRAYEHRIINIHPALIPAFCGPGMYGHHVHEAVLAYGAKISGATTHFVDEQVDHGGVIMQKSVPVLEGDTPETLAARVLTVEHEILPESVRLFCAEKLGVDGRQVHVL